MKSFKQYINEQKVISYHGAGREWEWDENELARNKFQRRFFSSNKKSEAKKYGKIIHKQEIDTTNYHHTVYKSGQHEKTIMKSIRKGLPGVVFHNMPNKDGDENDPHTEIVTFDHKTVKKLGYVK
jgi:hypothetical protein